jgi:asparagine synthase (glutamine-hydrolysing)
MGFPGRYSSPRFEGLMCGIVGILDYSRGASLETVEAMLGAQSHRGPDDHGTWRSGDGRCALGNNRLAVIDLSPAGHQPFVDDETGNVIVFNGEIFNYKALRDQLIAGGTRFKSETDTEVILALYREHGEQAVRMLRGMFAFVIWDAREHHLFAARDRMGEKPLVYAEVGGGFAFASEIGPLMRNRAIPTEEDAEALELFLQLQYIPAPWTIYKSVRKFPAAHYGVVDASGLRLTRYWELEYRPDSTISEQEALETLEAKLFDAVESRMAADVPLGTTLSGGVDSSLVTAIMSRISGTPVKTFNVALEAASHDESRYAKMVAEACGTDHVSEVLEPDVTALLPTIVQHYGEPYADKGCVPAFFISQVARRDVTVALDGDGGDELLGGYPMYRLPSVGKWLSNRTWPAAKLGEAIASLQDDDHLLPGIRRRLTSRYLHPEVVPLLYTAFWGDQRRGALLGDGAPRPSAVLRWREAMLSGADVGATDTVDRMLWVQNHSYLPYDGLVKMDIASMHCSLEVRTPLVDHEVIEYCATLPSSIKVKGGVPKHPLKAIAEKYVPKEVLYRPKQGFAIPVASWLATDLKPLLNEIVSDRELMAPFNSDVLSSMHREFNAGAHHHESRLWAIMMYGLWRRHGRP